MLISLNIQNSCNLNFESKIILSKKVYSQAVPLELLLSEKCVTPVGNIKKSIYTDEGVSFNASICTMGFLKSKASMDGYYYHSNPGDKLEDVEEELSEAVKKIRRTSKIKKVEGFVTGANFFDEKSLNRFKQIMGILDNLEVDYSAIGGQMGKDSLFVSKPEIAMYASAPKDTYILDWTKLNPKLFWSGKEDKIFKMTFFEKAVNFFLGKIQTPEDKLEQYFSIIKKRPEDEIILL